MRVSAQTTTTITLIPVPGQNSAGDMARVPTDIVITWATARDQHLFPNGAGSIDTVILVDLDRL